MNARTIAATIWLASLVLLFAIFPPVVIDAIALLVLVIIPGWGLAWLIVPASVGDGATRMLAVVGLGLAATVLVGVIVDLSPFGIRPAPWIMLAIALVVVGRILLRGGRTRQWSLPTIGVDISATQMATFGLAALLAVSAFGISRAIDLDRAPDDLAQLWMIPDDNGTYEIGVANLGQGTEEYRLVLRAGDETIEEWQSIRLMPGEEWRYDAPERPAAEVRAVLYRATSPDEPYREVVLAAPPSGE